MNSSKVWLLLLPVLIANPGCATPPHRASPVPNMGTAQVVSPPFAKGVRLNEDELKWFVKAAQDWLQPEAAAGTTGKSQPQPATKDQKQAIGKEQSLDGTMVTVSIPQRIEGTSQYWMVVYLNAQTGEVVSSGAKRLPLPR